MVYDIHFVRLPDQQPMEEVLCRPWVEEIEDYKEYKRLRQLVKNKKAEAARPGIDGLSTLAETADGTCDVDWSSSGTSDDEMIRSRRSQPRQLLSCHIRHKDSEDDYRRSDSMFD